MICALVDSQTRAVVNLIVADPSVDLAPEGFELALVPDGVAIAHGCLYSVERGFIFSKSVEEPNG